MPMTLPNFKELFERPARYAFGIAAFGLLVLFTPQGLAVRFGLDDLPRTLRTTVGLLTLAALVFGVVQLVPPIQTWRKRQEARHRRLEQLDRLSEEEREFIYACRRGNHQTVTMEYSNPYATALMARGLMTRYSGQGNILEWPFTIPDDVWAALPPPDQLPPSSVHPREVRGRL